MLKDAMGGYRGTATEISRVIANTLIMQKRTMIGVMPGAAATIMRGL